MMNERSKISLCILSDAAGGRYETADCSHQQCPLALAKKEAKHCPCKSRTDVGRVGGFGYRNEKPISQQIVQVLACNFPRMWNGDVIKNAEAFAGYIRRKAERK